MGGRRRVLLGHMEQETAVFNPIPTAYEMFSIHHGEALLEEYAGTATELGGYIEVLAQGRSDIEIVPTMAAKSVPGGVIPTADLDRLIAEMCGSISAAAAGAGGPPPAGVLLSLHGAMAGETEHDPEGRLLRQVRKIVGDTVPVVISIDLHCVLTPAMIEFADIIVPFHTYPHVDQRQTGVRAARSLLQLIDAAEDASGWEKPEIIRIPLPMLVRGDELITGRVPTEAAAAAAGDWRYSDSIGAFGVAIKMCQDIEASDGGLSAGVTIGNAFTDVPELRTNILVVRVAGQRDVSEINTLAVRC
jgi:microcystin degradation protein MlrC